MISRHALAAKIKDIHTSALSGVMSVVTDQGRSVSLRFFEGRITRIQSRGSDLQSALALMVQADDIKFNFVESTVAEEKESLPALYVVELLEEGPEADTTAIDTTETPSVEDVTIPQANPKPVVDRRTLKRVLTELALVHIGPMAEMVVEDAINENSTFEQIINAIAENIPLESDARTFRIDARERIKAEMNS